jgi:diguanylate cyclase (GGDEF)-like protein/PAS domain S-box-containing protein
MKRLFTNPVVRLSLGLSLFLMTLLMGLQMLGVLPDPQQAIMASRKETCESLAIYASLAIQKHDFNAIRDTIDLLRQRNSDILSVALRREDGVVLAATGDHAHHWHNAKGEASTLQNVKVPLFIGRGDARWGRFEVCFAPMHPDLLHRIWAQPIVKILALTLPLAFIGFFLIMKKTLRHLDPSAVIPERVKHTLDSLVEGVILMDRNERIVLTNKAFEEDFGDSNHTSFIGTKASELKWRHPRTLKPVKELPWQRAIQDGDRQTAIPLWAKDSEGKRRTFMVSGAPIIDAGSKIRGALATFDDVTQVEAQNAKFEKSLNDLQKSRDEVRRQNKALQLMTIQDPLTECLNRGAFYEQLEDEFNRAGQNGHELACIMVDIDYLKSINDTHGHHVGDKVLKQVSSILRGSLRNRDVVCRYGGGKFCLLLPETSWLDALSRAEQIRRAVSVDATGVSVTISMGVSALEFQPVRPSELLDQSDKALGHAKNSGRDKTVVFNELPATLRDGNSGEGRTVNAGEPKADQHILHQVVETLLLALQQRDASTAEHCRKVAELCVAAARSLMTKDECAVLEIAGMLHDIGKLGVPDAILLKQGPLAEKERQVMKDHERRSVDMIASIFSSPELAEIVKYRSHWFDGSHAEDDDRLRGEQIPLGARLLLIADAFDAMVSDRPYRKARSYTEAYRELRRCAGTQFDPRLVEHFIVVVDVRGNARGAGDAALPDPIELAIDRKLESLFTA